MKEKMEEFMEARLVTMPRLTERAARLSCKYKGNQITCLMEPASQVDRKIKTSLVLLVMADKDGKPVDLTEVSRNELYKILKYKRRNKKDEELEAEAHGTGSSRIDSSDPERQEIVLNESELRSELLPVRAESNG
jgi:hypothetical protein